MDITRSEPRYSPIWQTVAVTALPPGWRNVFEQDGSAVDVEPCPAMLLQELRGVRRAVDVRRADGSSAGHESSIDHREPPYETRVVFATYRGGQLGPVIDVSDHVGVLGPGDEPSRRR